MLGYITHPGLGATDRLMRELAAALEAKGLRLAGAVQENQDHCESPKSRMELRLLGQTHRVLISQDLGPHAEGCRLDAAGLEDAAATVMRDLSAAPQMLILNKFGKQEREGKGFRDAIAMALEQEIPVILGVSTLIEADFLAFAEGLATKLPNDPDALLQVALDYLDKH